MARGAKPMSPISPAADATEVLAVIQALDLALIASARSMPFGVEEPQRDLLRIVRREPHGDRPGLALTAGVETRQRRGGELEVVDVDARWR